LLVPIDDGTVDDVDEDDDVVNDIVFDNGDSGNDGQPNVDVLLLHGLELLLLLLLLLLQILLLLLILLLILDGLLLSLPYDDDIGKRRVGVDCCGDVLNAEYDDGIV
jgi:hypothetical protein